MDAQRLYEILKDHLTSENVLIAMDEDNKLFELESTEYDCKLGGSIWAG